MTLLRVNHLTVRYERHIAVENVSFSVEEGDYISVVGENGSGKSTLIKAIAGLIPPAAGSVELCGIDRHEIGYLPQSTIVQKDFPASVTEVVMTGFLGGRKLPFYTSAQKKSAHETMEMLNIADLSKKSFRGLSGGQQQRVLLARALCSAKKLLILDEPMSVLDPVVTHELYAILHRLNREKGMTVLMVSHDIHCAVEQSATILHMDREQRFFGPTERYFETELYERMTGGCGHGHAHEGGHHGHEHEHHDDASAAGTAGSAGTEGEENGHE